MHCAHCGAELPDVPSKFCLNCGKTLENENGETPAPESAAPKKPISWFSAALIICGFLGFVFAIVATAAVPASWQVAGPLLCPETTQDYVVLRTTHYTGEGTNVDATLYCVDAQNNPLRADSWWVGFVVFGVYFAGAFVLFFILIVLLRSSIRRRFFETQKGAPIGPQY